MASSRGPKEPSNNRPRDFRCAVRSIVTSRPESSVSRGAYLQTPTRPALPVCNLLTRDASWQIRFGTELPERCCDARREQGGNSGLLVRVWTPRRIPP